MLSFVGVNCVRNQLFPTLIISRFLGRADVWISSVDGFYYGGGWEGEVYVGYEAVLEADAEAAVAGAAYGQEFAFNPAVVVGDAYASAYYVGQIVVAGRVECHFLLGGGGGDEICHFSIAYYYGLPVWQSLDIEVFDADVAAYDRVDAASGVVDEKYVGYGRRYFFYLVPCFDGHALFHRHEKFTYHFLCQLVAVHAFGSARQLAVARPCDIDFLFFRAHDYPCCRLSVRGVNVCIFNVQGGEMQVFGRHLRCVIGQCVSRCVVCRTGRCVFSAFSDYGQFFLSPSIAY